MNNKRLSFLQRLSLRFSTKRFMYSTLLPEWVTRNPIWKEWSTETAIREGYKASTYVFACVNRLNKAIAQVPWKVGQVQPNSDDIKELPGHPLEILLKKPNPFMSGQDLFERLSAHLYLGGNGIWLKVRANKIVGELWPLQPDCITPVPGGSFISRYEYRYLDIVKNYDPKDICHLMFIDPANMWWGCSPLQAGAKVVDTDIEAVNWNKVAMQNRAIADGVFSFKQPLTKDQWEEARRLIGEQHQGSENARMPWVLGNEATWQQMSLSPAEMDFINSRKMTRVDICAIFQVPPPMVGVYDDATLANIKTARLIFWLDTVIPTIEDIQSALNLSLTPEFGDDLIIYPDLSNIDALRALFAEKVDTAYKLWTMGVAFNVINQRLQLGFKKLAGHDTGYLSAAYMPISLSGTTENIVPTPKALLASPLKKKDFLKQRRRTNEERKAFYWKAFERQRINWYRNANGVFVKTLKNEANEISGIFERDGKPGISKYFTSQKDIWTKTIRAIGIEVATEFGKNTFNRITGGKTGPGFETKQEDFDPQDAAVLDWSKQHSAMRATLITNTSKDLANNFITQGLADGNSTDQISKDLRQFYSEQINYRAMRTARTEVVGASNYGSYEAAKQTEVVKTKTWISSQDDRVRDEHDFMDGESVGLDDVFSNGLEYPGDEVGDAEEVINCRCVLSYEIEEGEMIETIEPEMYSEIPERDEVDVDWRDIDSQIAQDYAARGITVSTESTGSMATDNLVPSEAARLHGTVLRWSSEEGSDHTRYLQQYFAKNGKYPDELPVGWYNGTDPTVAKQILQDSIDDIKKLEKMIDVLPNYPEDKILWRGLELTEHPETYESLKILQPGDIIDMRGTSSWAPNTKIASQFAQGGIKDYTGDKSVMFVLEGGSKQSASISYMAEYSKEKEIIISQASRFEIVNIEEGLAKDVLGKINPGTVEAEKSRLYIIVKEVK